MGVVSCGTTMLDQGVFENIGAVSWDTTAKTTTITGVAGVGYFVNTTAGAITANLPAGTAGDVIAFADYANTTTTNNITIAPNGSEKIQGSADSYLINVNGTSITLVYVDSTQGWKLVDTGENSSLVAEPVFTTATGGTITCCGDYKIHTFTGPGTFCVSVAGNVAANPAGGPNTASYMVVAGGGAGAGIYGGGGGAGGFREGRDITPSYTASPLVAPAGITLTSQTYTVTVGAGGAPNGNPSTFSTITSTGGGGGITNATSRTGGSGSGGSGNGPHSAGSGNTPPVSPPQGNPGGAGPGSSSGSGGGGGGAGASGSAGFPVGPSTGGNGVSTSISGSSVTRAGGGAGALNSPAPPSVSGGTGGGGPAINVNSGTGTAGTANTGGGGGGGSSGIPYPNFLAGGAGGSGIVIIRYKFQ